MIANHKNKRIGKMRLPITRSGKCRPCKNERCHNVIFPEFNRHRECPKCRHRKWCRKNRLKRLWYNLRVSANRRGYSFELYPFSKFRAWCYLHSFKPKSYLPHKKRPSIDRKDESQGYTFDNIQVLTVAANSIKSNKYRNEIQKEGLLSSFQQQENPF